MRKTVRRKDNFNRQRIIDNSYLDYLDFVPDSERNKKIVCDYVAGKSYGDLGKEYNLSAARISAVVANYVRHVVMHLRGVER